MPEETAVDGANQSHSVALDSTESSAQEPSSKLGADSGPNGSSDGTQQQQEHEPKPAQQQQRESRYERTKRERAQFKAQQAEFSRQQAEFARQRAEFEEKQKPRRDYTLADLRKYRGQWENEGNFDLVDKADREIKAMEAEEQAERQARTVEMPPLGSPQHMAQWQAAEKELAAADKEFMRSGTRLDTRLRQIMQSEDGNIYRQHPRGIVAAYHRAKMELTEADLQAERTKNSKLTAELQRLTGLTSIDGGAPGNLGSGSRIESVEDFARLSTKDMRKHLMRQSRNAPWF